eukprot:606475-Rhodomonas_salina.2
MHSERGHSITSRPRQGQCHLRRRQHHSERTGQDFRIPRTFFGVDAMSGHQVRRFAHRTTARAIISPASSHHPQTVSSLIFKVPPEPPSLPPPNPHPRPPPSPLPLLLTRDRG